MKIIIVGAGEVGTELAKRLTQEKHDVIVLEKNIKKASNIMNTLDVMVIGESGHRVSALEQAGIKSADVLIAATDTDEINIMSCMIAKKLSSIKTVARVRNPEYGSKGLLFSNEQLGIDIMINSEEVMASEITKLIKTPAVNEIAYFANGKIELLSFSVKEDSELIGKQINTLRKSHDFLIIAIVRVTGEVVIPHGKDEILPNDSIYVVGKTGFMSELSWLVRTKNKRAKSVMILGGGKHGLMLGKMLEKNKNGMSLKLVEKSEQRCQELSEALCKTLILNGDARDLTFLKEQNMEHIDILVSLTGSDEINILTAALAKELGVKKTIIEISRPDYEFATRALKIDSFISPRHLVASQLAKIFRKRNVVSETILREGKAEVLELMVPAESVVTNKNLINLKLPKGIIIGGIVRRGRVIIPKGEDKILPGDRVIVFTDSELVPEVELLFSDEKIGQA